MATAAPNSNDILGNARFSSGGGSRGPSAFGADGAPTASSILGASSIDPSALHPLAGLTNDKAIDYLLLEDEQLNQVQGGKSVMPSRGWGDELCYGTGSSYLAGLAAGGLWGLREGLRKPLLPRTGGAHSGAATAATSIAGTMPGATAPLSAAIGAKQAAVGADAIKASSSAAAAAAGASTSGAGAGAGATSSAAAAAQARRVSRRLRWNHVLNQVTSRGTFTGNNVAILALIYNAFNSTLDSYRGGVHDIYGSMAAGAATGAFYRCTSGVRPMVVTSAVLTMGAAAWTTLKLQFL